MCETMDAGVCRVSDRSSTSFFSVKGLDSPATNGGCGTGGATIILRETTFPAA